LLRGGLDGTVDEPNPEPLSLFGDFEIARREDGSFWELGSGAMGVTYRATDKVLNRSVALKVIETPAAALDSKTVRERFLREARAAAALKHPNVAGIFQFGARPESDRCYYAMELVDGETLEALVRRDGPLTLELALEIAIQVTRALVAAAAQGLVHRDLKPGNVMVARGDASTKLEVKVIDFGLAKATRAAGETDLTHGGFVGTPSFASPEQFAGAPADARSDIYSLGITVWYLLTGQVPFPGRTIDEIRSAQVRMPLPVEQLVERKIPATIIALLRSVLASDPAQRPASARELIERLELCRAQLLSRPKPGKYSARRTFAAAAGIGAVLLLATGLALLKFRQSNATNHQPSLALDEKSIAVLPFENLSAEAADAFFADGIQDDILTSLGKIRDLTVIARPSVMEYRGGKINGKLREIGQALQVSHVLEGSVRRLVDRVVVNVELIDTRNDREVWSEHYDRNSDDVLNFQGQLAGEIAIALHATLSAAEKAAVENPPTKSVPAYEAYLRGMAAEEGGADQSVNPFDSEHAFTEAVQLDPRFALAWAKLSMAHDFIYWMGWDYTAARLAQAKTALEMAGRLAPDSGEFYLARGYYHYRGEKNYAAAVRDFEEASKRLPNNASALDALGLIDRRLGRWDEALNYFTQAARLDPRNDKILSEWSTTLRLVRRFDEDEALINRRLQIAPNNPHLIAVKAWIYQLKGDLGQAAKLLQPLPLQPRDSTAFRIQLDQLRYERHYPKLISILQDSVKLGSLPNTSRGFLLIELGETQSIAGDKDAARASFLAAKELLEKERKQAGDAHDVAETLAWAYADLGEREAALKEIERSLAIVANDTLDEPSALAMRTEIYAQLGDAENALRDLPRLLQTPASDLTPGLLRLDPVWDPIRNDPRFRNLAMSK
jgi:serine/threonine protein kinase/Tfp pilus assembly protein PilF